MNALELLEMNKDRVVYTYRPDGKGEPGEVEYIFSDGQAYVSRQSSDDTSGRFGFKACREVAEYVQENNLPIRCVQAWY